MSYFTSSQLGHITRRIHQVFKIPQVAIIGGYHGVNIGDLALGYAVKAILKQRNISSGFQTIYNLEKWKWPISNKAIIGGGAVGYNNLVELISLRYHAYPQNVAFLGVDFNDDIYSKTAVEFLKKVKWISCRSKDQVHKLESITGRKDIFLHPDLAFSLPVYPSKSRFSMAESKKLLLNLVPLYGTIENGKIIPLNQFSKERPDIYQNWHQIQSCYHTFVRLVVEQYLSHGYVIESLPFTPMDRVAAMIMLKGLKVKHHAYYPDPIKVMKLLKNANIFFATRYHATIFGLKQNLKVIPFAYAKKNEELLIDLAIPNTSYLKPQDFSDRCISFDRVEPIDYDHLRIKQLQLAATKSINDCINWLLNDK